MTAMAELMNIAEVAVAAPLDKTLSYVIPETLAGVAVPGVRVRVPLGRRTATGYLLSTSAGEGAALKPLGGVLDTEPLFSPPWAEFLRRAAAYYRYPIGEVFRCALPAGLSGTGNDVPILSEKVYSATPLAGEPPGEKQKQVLAYVRAQGAAGMEELRGRFASPHAVLNRLVALGHLEVAEVERQRDPFRDQAVPADPALVLDADQQAAVEALVGKLREGFSAALLHGVTGSGKTEVYLRLIAAAVRSGRQALVLVPEIALTPQLVGRFRARFAGSGVDLAVLHSGLSDGERYDAWRRIARGEARIVIGARSAVFAPLVDPGVIVVDEEHETSYKQSEGFRYHARDLALLRGQSSGALVLLGSATPSLPVYRRAREGELLYLPLTGRASGRPLPEVALIDMREAGQDGPLSEPLFAALEENFRQGGQSLLLLNRRGFSPYLICGDCGLGLRCPNCEITLTYHQSARKLLCHYCDYDQAPPDICPGCNGYSLLPEGCGTERLEEDLARRLPGSRILRMDRDTTLRKGAHQRLVASVMAGDVDILVGTQMIAKGHDFPGVTLVGVIDADNSLNFPDFRSAERTFALLVQVAGRAGRGDRPGRVLVQTWSPEHYALQCAAKHDYQAFYEQEVSFRQALGYPPFGHLVNLVMAGNDAARVERAGEILARELERFAEGVDVLGPAPCPLAKLRGKTRRQILLKAERRLPLHRLLHCLEPASKRLPRGIRLTVDVDPVDML